MAILGVVAVINLHRADTGSFKLRLSIDSIGEVSVNDEVWTEAIDADASAEEVVESCLTTARLFLENALEMTFQPGDTVRMLSMIPELPA